MNLKIKRRIETKRAPKVKDTFGGHYTPAGIDIYTTDDPDIVSLNRYGSDQRVRVDDLLAILDELDRFEERRHLDGEKMEINLNLVPPEDEKGDVYHRAGFLIAKPSHRQKGLVCLEVYYRMSLGSHTLTADRRSLREALENRTKLAQYETEDMERLR